MVCVISLTVCSGVNETFINSACRIVIVFASVLLRDTATALLSFRVRLKVSWSLVGNI